MFKSILLRSGDKGVVGWVPSSAGKSQGPEAFKPLALRRGN